MNQQEAVRRAGCLLRQGELVAFPTETVYGLGANALDAGAVERIFQAKARPASSPLIVHVDSVDMARSLVSEWPPEAGQLARRWWPGPLTLVLPKQPRIPDNVTAGLPTIAVRMPAHPLALALITEAGVPVAAPSANPFGRLSPTTADHVRQALGDRVAFILDGGPCIVGIESTVVSLVEGRPVLLRPGMISAQELEAVVGPLEEPAPPAGSHPSPGMHPRHYSPRTPLLLVKGGDVPRSGRGVFIGWGMPSHAVRRVEMPREPREYAGLLYDTLHRLDAEGWDWIAVESPPEGPDWEGVLDRLRRAASSAA